MPVQTCLQLVVSKTATVGPFCGSADSQGYKSRCSRAIERLKIYVPPLDRAKGSSWKQPIHAIDERFDNIIHIACRVEQSARLSSPNWVADATSQSRKGCAMFVGTTAVPTIASSDCVPLSDIAQSTSPLQSQIFCVSGYCRAWVFGDREKQSPPHAYLLVSNRHNLQVRRGGSTD
jgi:hypothetical protein